MDYQLNTRLNGNIAMTSSYHERASLQRDKTLYKFIWVQSGTLTLEIDHIPMRLEKDEIVTLTPLHHLEVKEVDGEYLTFVFNSNFYCIYGHDNEVSCNGFLFYGSSKVMKLALSAGQSSNLHDIVRIFRQESVIHDNLQEEMLRIVLKRFIITCTRIARQRFGVGQEKEKTFDIIRQRSDKCRPAAHSRQRNDCRRKGGLKSCRKFVSNSLKARWPWVQTPQTPSVWKRPVSAPMYTMGKWNPLPIA